MKVSIILPTYNRGNTIKRAIESLLNQTYSDFEVLVIDDGSTDNTREIVKGIKDKRIRYYHQENKGAGAARNKGILLAKGEYIAFHDSDDVWYCDKLRSQIEIIESVDADVVFTSYFEVTEKGNTIGPYGFSQGFQIDLINKYGIAFATILGKSNVFKENLFDEYLPRLQDFELVYRLCKKYTFYYLDKVLYEYDNYGNNITSNTMKLVKACQYIIKKHPLIRKNKVLSKKISNVLIYNANAEREKNFSSTFSALKVALQYRMSVANLVKCFMITINIYSIYFRIRYRGETGYDMSLKRPI